MSQPTPSPRYFDTTARGLRYGLLAALFHLCGCDRAPSHTAGTDRPAASVAAPQPMASSLGSTSPLAAAAPATSAEPGAAVAAARQPLNVILLLVDSMRADMPWTGYPRAIAPNLTKLEAESVSYTRGYSVSSYTAKSVAAALSGKYPSSLIRSAPFFTHYQDANLFLAEVLRERGVETLSAQAHMYMKRGNGLDQGFVRWDTVPGIRFDAQTDNHVTSQKLTPLAIEQLGSIKQGQRFFMYLHYMDVHDLYLKHEESPDFGNKPRDRYDSEMFYADLWIGKLLDYCRQQPWWNNTALIVSADHGEAFGEHGITRHAFHLWDVLTHVPLFIRLPGVPARRIETPRSAIDLAPTVLGLMDIEAKHDFVGQSLVPELYGASEPEPRPVLLDLPADTNNPEVRGYIAGDYKLVAHGADVSFELFNLKQDPGETQNLLKREPEKLAEMKAAYLKAWSGISRVKPFGGQKLTGGGVANGPMK